MQAFSLSNCKRTGMPESARIDIAPIKSLLRTSIIEAVFHGDSIKK